MLAFLFPLIHESSVDHVNDPNFIGLFSLTFLGLRVLALREAM